MAERKYSKLFYCALMGLINILFITETMASEPIPRLEFISITEESLNILDELEAAFSTIHGNSSPSEIEQLFKKLDIAMKKYDRYADSWPKTSKQGKIIWAITETKLHYSILFIKWNEQEYKEAHRSAEKARKLYGKYKYKK